MARLLLSMVTESVYSPALAKRDSPLRSQKNSANVTINGNQEGLFSGACDDDRFFLAGVKEWLTPRYR